jgi:hypothetical protein
MKQKLHIAKGILPDPEVIFMDEPTIGLDPQASRETRKLTHDLIAQGKTILLTTHYMFEADELCRRIAVINNGKIVWQDNRANTNIKYRGCENCPEYNWDIYLYDILTGEEQAVATGPIMECDPDVSGDLVVWAEYKEPNNADIFMKSLVSGEVAKVADNSFHQWQPQVDDLRVVWTDESRGHSTNDVSTDFANADILMYDSRTGKTTRLTGDWIQSRPLISGPYVAFLYDTQVNPRYQVVRLP